MEGDTHTMKETPIGLREFECRVWRCNPQRGPGEVPWQGLGKHLPSEIIEAFHM